MEKSNQSIFMEMDIEIDNLSRNHSFIEKSLHKSKYNFEVIAKSKHIMIDLLDIKTLLIENFDFDYIRANGLNVINKKVFSKIMKSVSLLKYDTLSKCNSKIMSNENLLRRLKERKINLNLPVLLSSFKSEDEDCSNIFIDVFNNLLDLIDKNSVSNNNQTNIKQEIEIEISQNKSMIIDQDEEFRKQIIEKNKILLEEIENQNIIENWNILNANRKIPCLKIQKEATFTFSKFNNINQEDISISPKNLRGIIKHKTSTYNNLNVKKLVEDSYDKNDLNMNKKHSNLSKKFFPDANGLDNNEKGRNTNSYFTKMNWKKRGKNRHQGYQSQNDNIELLSNKRSGTPKSKCNSIEVNYNRLIEANRQTMINYEYEHELSIKNIRKNLNIETFDLLLLSERIQSKELRLIEDYDSLITNVINKISDYEKHYENKSLISNYLIQLFYKDLNNSIKQEILIKIFKMLDVDSDVIEKYSLDKSIINIKGCKLIEKKDIIYLFAKLNNKNQNGNGNININNPDNKMNNIDSSTLYSKLKQLREYKKNIQF